MITAEEWLEKEGITCYDILLDGNWSKDMAEVLNRFHAFKEEEKKKPRL